MNFTQIKVFSAKLHGSVRTAASVYGNIGIGRVTSTKLHSEWIRGTP